MTTSPRALFWRQRLCVTTALFSVYSAVLLTTANANPNVVYELVNPHNNENEVFTFDVTDRCSEFFNWPNDDKDQYEPESVPYCTLFEPVLEPWIEEGKNGIVMAMERGHDGGNPHAMCVLQHLVCESMPSNHDYDDESCTSVVWKGCQSALRHLHEMMVTPPEEEEQICNNFARKSIRGFFHDFMSNAIDGSILAEHNIAMNFGLCRWAQYVNVLSDETMCDPGSIIAMAGQLGYLACGVNLYNLDIDVKPKVTINRPYGCGSIDLEDNPLFDSVTNQRKEQFSDAQLASNSTAMEEFWYAANGHTHDRPDGEIEYSAEAAAAAHAVGRVTCPPDGMTASGTHPNYELGFFHEVRNGDDGWEGDETQVETDYSEALDKISQTQCDFSDEDSPQPPSEGIRTSTTQFPLTDKESDFNAEGGYCSMPTQFLGTVRAGGRHRVPRWMAITENSAKSWPSWSAYQSSCRTMMSMYIPLELLTIENVDLPQSNALQRFLDIAWDGYNSIDSAWDSCTVGCNMPILENKLCGATNNHLQEFDWNQEYCHEGTLNADGTICCDDSCNACSSNNDADDECNADIIAANDRECISAWDTECVIPKEGDGAVCQTDNKCKSGLCKGYCCNANVDEDRCDECGPSGGHCTKCKDGYKLEGVLCVDECSCGAGCIDCDCGVCKECDPAGYFLQDQACQLKRGEGKQCTTNKECLSSRCKGGYCCKSEVAKTCEECNNRGKCSSCKSGYTLCGFHEANEGFCKSSISSATTTFRCGTGGPDTDYPSSDGYNYCAMANHCPCSDAGCHKECEIEETCWIGSIADSLTDYEPSFVCKNPPCAAPTENPAQSPVDSPTPEDEEDEVRCTVKKEVPLIVTVKTDDRVHKDKTWWRVKRKKKTLGKGKLWTYGDTNGTNQTIEVFQKCVHKNKCYVISLWEKKKTKEQNYGFKEGSWIEVTFNGETTRHMDWKANTSVNWSVVVGNPNKC